MKRNKVTLRWLLIGAASVIIFGIGITLAQGTGAAQTSTVPADVAVSQALANTNDDGFFGGAVVAPSKLQGQLMTFDEARQFVLGRSIDASDGVSKFRNYPVWLIVLEGQFVEHVPAVPGIPGKEVMHSQMAIIIDANTAEVMEKYLISPDQRLPTDSLQVLTIPSGVVPPVPTMAPVRTDVPLPTVTP